MKRRITGQKRKSTHSFSLQDWLGLVLLVLIPGYYLRTCMQGEIESRTLARESFITKAFVINKKNYFGNSPVSRQFAYSYRFNVRGKTYEGNSRDPSLHIGDTILIEYAPTNPAYNRVLEKRN
jgi:hypothetical protein